MFPRSSRQPESTASACASHPCVACVTDLTASLLMALPRSNEQINTIMGIKKQADYHWRELPQVSFVATKVCLSRQFFCRDEHNFVTTKICCDEYNFVATKIILVAARRLVTNQLGTTAIETKSPKLVEFNTTVLWLQKGNCRYVRFVFFSEVLVEYVVPFVCLFLLFFTRF